MLDMNYDKRKDWLQEVIGHLMRRKTFISRSCTNEYYKDWFFFGELYGLSCCSCDIGNSFLYGMTKEKVYITAGPDLGANFCGKNLIINKSLY
jgi:hypothetical protein